MTDTQHTASTQPTSQKTEAQERYPNRYYAHYDPTTQQPAPVIGWYDMWGYSSLDEMPPLSELLPLSADFWQKHITEPQTSQAVQDGTIVAYTPPPYVPPLKDQANAAMQHVQQQASMVSAMGETFGPSMRDYVKALRAIINGTDTTSTALPTAPDDPTT